ncbi:MAG: thioesterase family protein [Bacillota bacterium]
MENINLKVGLTASVETRVFSKSTAEEFGSGDLDVYATPAMISLMERAALSAVSLHLPKGYSTVGTAVSIRHIAATPVGMKVKAVAELVGIEGRKLTFKIEAFDAVEKIGEGCHERYVISAEKFREKVYGKVNK